MTQHQRQQASIFATVAMIGTIIGGVGGTILGAYQFGDDRYVRKDEMISTVLPLRKDVEYMRAQLDRIERRQLGVESAQGTTPLASRSSNVHSD